MHTSKIRYEGHISGVFGGEVGLAISNCIILTGLFGSRSETYIFVDNGTGKSRKTIRIDCSNLTALQQRALIGFHAFTGNDYVSSFLRKTKKIWTKILQDQESLEFLSQLGDGSLSDEIYLKAEKFICKIYGDKRGESVNELRA